MSVSQYLNEEKLIEKTLKILTEKLGPVETSRFLQIVRSKKVESVKRHRDWQKRLNKEKFFNDIFQ